MGFLLKYYKKELQERLVEVLARIKLRWVPEFEKWFMEKKSKLISDRTLKDYEISGISAWRERFWAGTS